MAGGGSSGYTQLETYQTDIHRLMLVGKDTDNMDWGGTTQLTGALGSGVPADGHAGSGYSVGNWVYLSTGKAIIEILTVNAGAVVTMIVIAGGGGYDVGDILSASTLTGGGSGLRVQVTGVNRAIGSHGTYAQNPSVMRFILEKGLADVGGNPYTGVSGYDPSADLEEVAGALTEFKQSIDAITPSTGFATDITTATAQAERVLDELDVETIVSQALTGALASASTAVASSLANSHTAVKTIIDDAVSRSEGQAASLASSNLESALAQAKSIFSDAIGSVIAVPSGFSPSVDAMMNLAYDFMRQGATSILDEAVQSALTLSATSILDEAVQSALTLSDNGMIDASVDAFEQDTLPQHLSEINRFAGGAADVNAVNTSTFIVGMALMGTARSRDVNKYRADLRLQMFRDVLTSFTNIHSGLFTGYLNAYGQEKSTNVQLFQGYLNAYGQEKSTNVQLFQGLVAIMQHASGTELDALKTYFGTETGTVAATSQGWNQVYDGDRQGLLNSVINTRLQEKASRLNTILAGTSELGSRADRKLGLLAGYDALLAEVNRAKIVAMTEDYTRNLTYDVQAMNWDLDLFQKAGNILSAVTGAVVPGSDRPTALQTGLSVALGVGSIVAAIMAPSPVTLPLAAKGIKDTGTTLSNIG